MIDWWRDHRAVVGWLQSSTDRRAFLALSAVTLAEVFAGCPPERIEDRARAVRSFDFLPGRADTAIMACVMQRNQAQQGRAYHLPSLLQAALALALAADCVVATSNVKDFPDVPTFDPRTFVPE